MKALSIRQPWSWLIVNGYKDVENRTWATKMRGKVYVHAGQAFDREGYQWVKDNFPEIPLPRPDEFELGGLVGTVHIDDSFPPGSDKNGRLTSRWYFGEHGFLLSHGIPIPYRKLKGKLNFFEVPSE